MFYSVVLFAGLGSVFLGIVIGVAALAFGRSDRPAVARAIDTIDRVYAPGLAGESLRQRALAPAGQRVAAVGRALTPRGALGWLQRSLDYAGNPVGWAPERVMEMQGLGLIGGAAVGFMLGVLLDLSVFGTLAAVVAIGVVGLWLPFLIVYDLGVRRQSRIRRELPDALDLLTVSVEAGQGFDAAMAQVAESVPGPMGGELARVLQETQMGMARSEALRALAGRTKVMELRTMATAVVQAAELGIPTAQVLREQSREMRIKRKQSAEEAARKVPVKITLPLVLCLFPALFVIVIGPGVIKIIEAFSN